MRKLLLTWLALLALLALEVGASFLPLGRGERPLILIPALAMVAIVAVVFMQVRHGPVLVRLFAAAGVLWLVILLALGSLDPLTRIDYPVAAPSNTSPTPPRGRTPAIDTPASATAP
jgi:cytochrome c oxidase subunit 4